MYECNNFRFESLSGACAYASYLARITRIIHAITKIERA
mgnify:CR=1 FL=1|jgi:hypothetical protein